MSLNLGGYVKKRGTAMPDSDAKEMLQVVNQMANAWIASSAGFFGANATQVSNAAFICQINGTLQRIVASGGTANAIVGTVTTNTSAMYVVTVAEGGTVSNIMTSTFTTLTGFVLPSVPVSQFIAAVALVCATATAFNGGTNSFGDAAYTVSLYNVAQGGLAGLALATENIGVVPG